MREIKLDVNAPKLKINGHVFDVIMNDADIMHMATQAKARCANIDANDTEKLVETARYLADCIDAVLGEGAVKIISEGRPVAIKHLVNWLLIITDNALAAQFDKMVEDND